MEQYARVLGTALEIWQHKLKEKHLKTYNRLMREIRETESKLQQNDPSVYDSDLDQLYFELRLLGDSFAAHARTDMESSAG